MKKKKKACHPHFVSDKGSTYCRSLFPFFCRFLCVRLASSANNQAHHSTSSGALFLLMHFEGQLSATVGFGCWLQDLTVNIPLALDFHCIVSVRKLRGILWHLRSDGHQDISCPFRSHWYCAQTWCFSLVQSSNLTRELQNFVPQCTKMVLFL